MKNGCHEWEWRSCFKEYSEILFSAKYQKHFIITKLIWYCILRINDCSVSCSEYSILGRTVTRNKYIFLLFQYIISKLRWVIAVIYIHTLKTYLYANAVTSISNKILEICFSIFIFRIWIVQMPEKKD